MDVVVGDADVDALHRHEGEELAVAELRLSNRVVVARQRDRAVEQRVACVELARSRRHRGPVERNCPVDDAVVDAGAIVCGTRKRRIKCPCGCSDAYRVGDHAAQEHVGLEVDRARLRVLTRSDEHRITLGRAGIADGRQRRRDARKGVDRRAVRQRGVCAICHVEHLVVG